MKKQTTTTQPGALARLLKSTFTARLLPALILLLSIQASQAGSATWKASPTTNDWNTAGNWTTGGPPNGPADSATFAISSKTSVSLSATSTEVNGTVFNAGASAFTISVPNFLTISGVGITNNSGATQTLALPGGQILFYGNATAGSLTNFAISSPSSTGAMQFANTSSADHATFTNAGQVHFIDSSTAANGTFTNNGIITFNTTTTAANSTIINNGDEGAVGNPGADTQLADNSTAGSATLIANAGLTAGGNGGGSIHFVNDSSGGTARVEVFGSGTGDLTDGHLDISSHNAPGVTIGSIEGSGTVFLGANKLTVGANNLSTIFSGVIADGTNGTGGSLSKIGKGKLSLTKANTYTGGTTISKGALLAKNKTGSATGTGAVQVNAGTLGGTGKITGAVTIGTGSGIGAFLSPGNSAIKPGTLTITNNTLIFNSDSTYKCALDRTLPKATQVAAKGVTINSAAQFAFTDLGTGTLTAGTVFTVINNTSAAAIAGTFSNLANGSTFTSTGGTTFLVNYEGGTGNDLTLTIQ